MTQAHREQDAGDDRDETPDERLDRNTIELLNELRVVGTGIQVMFAFLLVVPFNAGWSKTTSFERTVYFVTLALVAVATFLLMAPPVQHRLLFRQHEKRYLITIANKLAIAGIAFLALGFTGMLVLLSDYVVGGIAPIIAGVLTLALTGGLWFALPLARRSREG
ncbi:MAG TPA: DUF6328 family protein [Solirubrobacteraceae bacterium]|jgi:hypothetical protein|nr:DUF6328 family protein [Solirubrobacteraceae bacterium]